MTKNHGDEFNKTPPSRSDTGALGKERANADASTALSVTLLLGVVVYYRDASTALSVTLFLGIVVRMPLAFDVAEGVKFVCIRAHSWLKNSVDSFPPVCGNQCS